MPGVSSENMNIKTALVALTLLCSCVSFAQERLCPAPSPLPEGADDLRIHESEFTYSRYLESLDFIQNEFPRRIRTYKEVSEFQYNTELWLGYYNSLKFIEGYVLKQAALNEVASHSEKREATDRFCQFLRNARYVD